MGSDLIQTFQIGHFESRLKRRYGDPFGRLVGGCKEKGSDLECLTDGHWT